MQCGTNLTSLWWCSGCRRRVVSGMGKLHSLRTGSVLSRRSHEADTIVGVGKRIRFVCGCQDLEFDREGSRERVAST